MKARNTRKKKKKTKAVSTLSIVPNVHLEPQFNISSHQPSTQLCPQHSCPAEAPCPSDHPLRRSPGLETARR